MELFQGFAVLLLTLHVPVELRRCVQDQGRRRFGSLGLSNYPKTFSSPGFYGGYTSFSDSYLALATLDTQFPEHVVGVGVTRQVLASLCIPQGLAGCRIGNASWERQPVAQDDLPVEHSDGITRTETDLVENALGLDLQIGRDAGPNHPRLGHLGGCRAFFRRRPGRCHLGFHLLRHRSTSRMSLFQLCPNRDTKAREASRGEVRRLWLGQRRGPVRPRTNDWDR